MSNATTEVRLQVDELRELFAYVHLPPHLQSVSRPFADLAERICAVKFWGNQTIDALQNLLRAKDSAVRAAVASDRLAALPKKLREPEPEPTKG